MIINWQLVVICVLLIILIRVLLTSCPEVQSSKAAVITAPNLPTFPDACKNPAVLGNEHDGGWKICLDANVFLGSDTISKDSCIAYSFGLGTDWSFDKALEEKGCEVHGFDPSGLYWREG